MGEEALYLVVTRGPCAGARARLGDVPRVVGRARDADLVLRDPQVSRKHLLVTGVNGQARLEVCDGAKPVLVNGEPQRAGTLQPGDVVVVGDTPVLLSRELDAGPAEELSRTDIGALMTGVAADVRGLATVMQLVGALDAATDAAVVLAALRAWGKEHLGASDVAVVHDGAEPTLPGGDGAADSLVERSASATGKTLLSAPMQTTSELRWLTFTCDAAPRDLTNTTRRLAAIAGRVAATAMTRIEALRRSEEERAAFRRDAIGSARSFLGESPAAREVAKLAARLSSSDVVVLLEGETGVGKTFLARILHESGARAKEPLRVLNCAAIPEALLESELFGHEKGAFTGATSAKAGALEAAGKGTVLLDEVGELPLVSQAKLLRVLEEKRFERLGSNRAVPLQARMLAATNRDLGAMVEAGRFRADLFYRLAVVKLRVPSLRERGDDLPLLAERILADLAPSAGRRVAGISPEAMEAIRRYPWPGNVRELRNAIERALAIGEGPTVVVADLPDSIRAGAPPQPGDESLVRLPAKLEWLEERAIEAALRATGGNQPRAALLLGINRATLHRKLKAPREPGSGER